MNTPGRFVLVVLTLLIAKGSCAQESITYLTAAEAANLLAGQNVTISNATYSGHPLQLARLNNGGGTLGVDEALALTTGKAAFAATDNDYTVNGQSNGLSDPDGGYEPDLNSLNGPGGVYNVAVLEFDFQTTAIGIVFNYVFASKEYTEYIGTNYNDVFGFFISGPNISGPFANNAVNIATIDGDPVSINTIHPFDPDTHPELYVDTWNTNPDCAYDGRTVLIQATLAVECNVTYHAKLAICNTGDDDFHTGVFIQSHTLSSPYSQPGALTILPQPVCEGQPLSLSVEGESSWLYTWSTGQSGVGMQQITTTASTSISDYSVTVQYLPRCSLTTLETQGRAVVHALNNSPPTCPGGDLYVQADHWLHFDIPSNDSPNEGVSITLVSGPGSFSVNSIPLQDIGHLSWLPSENDLGFHTVVFGVQDNNVCDDLYNTCEYTVKVICRYCPVCVYYENRSPSGLPLPTRTIAGACIVAGTDVDDFQTNGPVDTGMEDVLFKAPFINLEPGFIAGPGFVADPDPASCMIDCEECCAEGTGIIIDEPLPNVFTPNGDGVNDVWQVTDQVHPFCAYNANQFDLWIYSGPWGNNVVAHRSGEGYCCPFISRAPGVNVVSSINWDGRAGDNLLCNDCWVPDGVYMFVLEVENLCGDVEDYAGYVHIFDSPNSSGMVIQQTGTQEILSVPHGTLDGDTALVLHGVDKEVMLQASSNEAGTIMDEVVVYPNPTSSEVIVGCSAGIRKVQVLDAVGRLVQLGLGTGATHQMNLAKLACGSYHLLIQDTRGATHVRRLVKQ